MHPLSEFILGGQRSGKSRRGEQRVQDWLSASPAHRAVLLATAEVGDVEMLDRIERHRADRSVRVPTLYTDEDTADLATAVQRHSTPDTLVLIDCLTLWVTRWLMPLRPAGEGCLSLSTERWERLCEALFRALQAAPGPVVLVSNEIGLGLAPLSREARHFVDALGRLHQQIAQQCPQVTLMVAGLPVPVKREPPVSPAEGLR